MTPKLKKEIQKIDEQIIADSRKGDVSRARSFTVGTAFGGITEVGMRTNDGTYVWTPMQPVETIEFIHQLAANVGCHIQLVPRKDFSSWRDWKYTEAELAHYRGVQPLPGVGWPPHPNDMAPHNQVGANLPPPEQQPGLNFTGNSNGEAVAVEKSSDDGAADGAAEAS
jgi:hypothetical protein